MFLFFGRRYILHTISCLTDWGLWMVRTIYQISNQKKSHAKSSISAESTGRPESMKMMDKNRITRYVHKIRLIEERIADIKSCEDDFSIDKRSRLAIYKSMQEIVETSMDILAMRLKDSKKLPMDDYTNIDTAYESGIIDERIRRALKEANGLRNRLVHEYIALCHRSRSRPKYYQRYISTLMCLLRRRKVGSGMWGCFRY